MKKYSTKRSLIVDAVTLCANYLWRNPMVKLNLLSNGRKMLSLFADESSMGKNVLVVCLLVGA